MFADETMMENETLDKKLQAKRLMAMRAMVAALAAESSFNYGDYESEDDWEDEIYND